MADRINLEERATTAISEALYGMTTYDADALRSALDDSTHTEADNACTYHHHCAQIIQDYERDYPGEDMGGTYTAEQWQEAQTAYAYGVAYAALSSFVDAGLQEIEEAAEELVDLITDEAGDQFEGTLTIGAQCPHGWAPHDREDEDGTHYWLPAQLEGCHAIAREVSGVWLSFTWTAAPVVADDIEVTA